MVKLQKKTMSDGIKLQTIYMLKRIGGAANKDIYVGSTSLPLEQRFSLHKYNAKNFMDRGYNGKNLLFSRMLEVGVDNWEIIPLQVTDADRNTARAFELAWYNFYKPDLNSQVPFRLGPTGQEKDGNLNIARKKYHCGLCDRSYCANYKLRLHTNSKSHIDEYMKLDLD